MSEHRERLSLIGGGIVTTVALPIVFLQRWGEKNPYILTVLGLIATVFYLSYFFSGPWFLSRAARLRGKSPMLALATFIVGGAVMGGAIGWLAYAAIRINKAHLEDIEHEEVKAKNASEPAKPDFKITLVGGGFFKPDRPDMTGIYLQVRIWNAGAPSIATNWKLGVTTAGGKTVESLATKPSTTLNVGGIPPVALSPDDLSLEDRTSQAPLKIGDPVIDSHALFYVSLTKPEVNDPDTILALSVSDYADRRFSVAQRVGDWPSSTDAPALKAMAAQLSRDILAFLGDRRANEPPMPRKKTWNRDVEASRKYMDATLDEYSRRFAARVIATRNALAERGQTDSELDAFYEHPTNLIGIKTVGERIGALAERL